MPAAARKRKTRPHRKKASRLKKVLETKVDNVARFTRALEEGLAKVDTMDRATDTVVSVAPDPAPVPETAPVPTLVPEAEQEVIVDTSLEAMRNGAPPHESAGRYVAPDIFQDVIPNNGPALGDLLQQPFALANGGTAWVQNVHWDVGVRGDAKLRITMVTNDANTTPIYPGDGYVVNQDGGVEPVTFRRSPSTIQYHSETLVDMEMMQTSSATSAMMLEDLTQCISDQLTMEINSMVGQPNTQATWSTWCARQRLLTSASNGTFTVTNSSTINTNVTGTVTTTGTGGIFDYVGLTTTAADCWATPEWIRVEHTDQLRRAVKDASWPHVQHQAETSEERIAREERDIKAAAEREKRAVIQRKKEAEKRLFAETSKERARHLLSSMLSPEQREEFQEEDCFHLTVIDGKTGEERIYRIDQGFQGNVKLLGPDGRPVKSYCIHTKTTDDEGRRLPNEDHMLAQKLLLQTDEKSFLKIANMSLVRN